MGEGSKLLEIYRRIEVKNNPTWASGVSKELEKSADVFFERSLSSCSIF